MTRSLAALAVLAALALAGCAGDAEDNNEYVGKVNAAQEKFVKQVEGLQARDSSSPDAVADDLDQLVTAVKGVAGEIRAIKPPEDAAVAHGQLAKVLDDYAADLDAASDGLDSGDPTEAAKSAQDVIAETAKAQRAFDTAINRLNQELR